MRPIWQNITVLDHSLLIKRIALDVSKSSSANQTKLKSYLTYCCFYAANEDEIYLLYIGGYQRHVPNDRQIAGPHWTFAGWEGDLIDNFHDYAAQMADAGLKPAQTNKIGWYGDVHSPAANIYEHHTRPLLVNFTTDYPELFDFRHSTCKKCAGYSMVDQVQKYSFLLDIGGNGLSGRLKYLLFSRRPVFLVDRDCWEYFFPDLIPYTHYIPVFRNLTNLVEQVEWARKHPIQAREIGESAHRWAVKHFTQEHLISRIYQVLLGQCEVRAGFSSSVV